VTTASMEFDRAAFRVPAEPPMTSLATADWLPLSRVHAAVRFHDLRAPLGKGALWRWREAALARPKESLGLRPGAPEAQRSLR
jgi:hypothetical protein